jgi:hypothetical protein
VRYNIRDIGRRIAGDDTLQELLARELSLARCAPPESRQVFGIIQERPFELHIYNLCV